MPYEENPFAADWTARVGPEWETYGDLPPERLAGPYGPTEEEHGAAGQGRLPTAQERAEASRAELHKRLGDDMRAQIAKGIGWDDFWRAARLASGGVATEGGVPFNPGAYEPEPFSLPGVAQSRNPLNAAGDRFIMQEVTPIPGAWLSKYGKGELPPEQPVHYFQPHAPMSGPNGWEAPVKATPGDKQWHDVMGHPTIPTLKHMDPKGVGGALGTVASWAEDSWPWLLQLLLTKGRGAPIGSRGFGMGASTVESLPKKPPQ
jgi:hypothetical protein